MADVVSMASLVPKVPVTKIGRLTIRHQSLLRMKRAHHPIPKL